MGWSCAVAAARITDAWSAACFQSTGSSNTWKENGAEYFFETSRKEYKDGAITGEVWQISREAQPPRCKKVGTFRVNGDGTIKRAPKWLKDAAVKYRRS